MRQLAIAVASVLVLAMISPAFAQPFADTPTNHWAYDAIAELAAKGLIEGYPDGTFKGDRAMTRYEMAMVVARLLARIESIQIPTPAPPPKPEVTKADIDMILRLVNEFRAELAAKNVRLTAVEEELNAIKAKLDNVRITGAYRFRYDMNQFNCVLAGVTCPAGTTSLNGNPNTTSTSSSNVPRGNRPRQVFRIQFDGSVAPDVHFITVLMSNGIGGSGYAIFNSSRYGPGSQQVFGTIDDAFFQWKNAFGWPLEIWLGRFGGGAPGPSYPVQFGPFGLLFNTGGDTWEDSTGDSGANVADGIRVAFNLSNLADLRFQGVWIRIIGGLGSFSYPSGEDVYGGDLSIKLFEGFRVGVNYVSNSIGNFGSATGNFQPAGTFNIFYHLYGPGGGSMNPGATIAAAGGSGAGGLRCATVAGLGIQCPAQGNGWGAYAQWDALPGIHLDVEAAQWSDTTSGGGTDSGFQATVTLDLATLVDLKGLTVTAGYQYYGPNFYPPYGAAEADIFSRDLLYPGNAQGFLGTVSWAINPLFTVSGGYLTGNNVSNSQPFSEWDAAVSVNVAPNARLTFRYADLSMNGVDQLNLYRAQFDYRF
jgi:hypothetical protein